jgi:dynein assembly factor 3
MNGKFYTKWRLSGIAFEIRDGTYNVPNKTLASGIIFKKEGERIARRGYWGDILVSPYVTFGLECEEKSFFKKSNNILTRVRKILDV